MGILRSRRSPVPLIIIVEMLGSIWNERNDARYRGLSAQIPIPWLLQKVVFHVKALLETCHSNKKRRIWEKELDMLTQAANLPTYTYNSDD